VEQRAGAPRNCSSVTGAPGFVVVEEDMAMGKDARVSLLLAVHTLRRVSDEMQLGLAARSASSGADSHRTLCLLIPALHSPLIALQCRQPMIAARIYHTPLDPRWNQDTVKSVKKSLKESRR